MRSLRDENENADAVDALLGRLMRSVGPLPQSEVRKRRVLAAVRSRLTERVGSRAGLRPALAAAVLLLIGGIAGATVGRSAWDRLVARVRPAPAKGPSLSQRSVEHHVGRTFVTSPGAAPSGAQAPAGGAPTSPLPSVGGAPTASNVGPVGTAALGDRNVRSRRVSAAEQSALLRESERAAAATAKLDASRPLPDEDRESDLEVKATRFWRENQHPKARVLAEDYLRHFPEGQAAEMMFRIAISVAAEERDPEAGTLGRIYLGRFPNGPFQEMAKRAILRFPQ